jgi:hypothetical protein
LQATIQNNKATIQNNKATYTSLFTNEKVKTTLTRQLLPQNRPDSACFSFSYEDNLPLRVKFFVKYYAFDTYILEGF